MILDWRNVIFDGYGHEIFGMLKVNWVFTRNADFIDLLLQMVEYEIVILENASVVLLKAKMDHFRLMEYRDLLDFVKYIWRNL